MLNKFIAISLILTGWIRLSAQQLPEPGNSYAIINKNSEKCLEVFGAMKRPGTHIQQWEYFHGDQQYFSFQMNEDSSFKIKSDHSGLYLSLFEKGKGKKIYINNDRGNAGQKWDLVWEDSVYFRIRSKYTGFYIDVIDRSTKSRAPLIMNNSSASKSTLWRLFKKPKSKFTEIKITAKPENLGSYINTQDDEVYPVITPDGSTLYFNRKNMPQSDSSGKDDIYFSTLKKDGKWSYARPLGTPINNKHHNFLCSISSDGKRAIFGSKYLSPTKSVSGVSFSVKDGVKWKLPQGLKVDSLSNRVNWSGYYLGQDGKTLVIAVAMPYCYGRSDLYVSFLQSDSSWTKPKNLGPMINTPVAENTPFLAADGKTLYFASEGHGGHGYSDVFMTQRLDDTWEKWSPPINLGAPFSTSRWDAYFNIPASGEYAYFVSETNSIGKSDIFRVKLPEGLKPDPVVMIKGRVLDRKSNEPVEAKVYYKKAIESGEDGSTMSDKNGNYSIILPAGHLYEFLADKTDYVGESALKDTRELKAYEELQLDLFVVSLEEEEIFELRNLFFELNKYIIKPESNGELERLLKMLKTHPKIEIEIHGHTDPRGSDEYNKQLSQKRAESVRNFLVEKGISGTRLKAIGFGATMPGDRETDEEKRRVEVKIVRK